MTKPLLEFTTRILTFDEPNKNGLTYSKEAFKDIIDKDFSRLGMMFNDFKNDSILVDIASVSHIVSDFTVVSDGDKEKLMCKVRVLDTPKGHKLKQLIEAGGMVFKPRGLGKPELDDNGNLVVKSFELVSISAISKDQAA